MYRITASSREGLIGLCDAKTEEDVINRVRNKNKERDLWDEEPITHIYLYDENGKEDIKASNRVNTRLGLS